MKAIVNRLIRSNFKLLEAKKKKNLFKHSNSLKFNFSLWYFFQCRKINLNFPSLAKN